MNTEKLQILKDLCVASGELDAIRERTHALEASIDKHIGVLEQAWGLEGAVSWMSSGLRADEDVVREAAKLWNEGKTLVGVKIVLIDDLHLYDYTVVEKGETGVVAEYASNGDAVIKLDKVHPEIEYFGNTISREWPYHDQITGHVALV
jgi:hypothetical protein